MKLVKAVPLLILLVACPRANAYLETSWQRFYNGSASGYDYATAVAYSPAGYIFVTGAEADSSGVGHIVLLKYSSTGNFEWEKTHVNLYGQWDYAWGVAADSAGNSYVAGRTYVLGGSAGFLTCYNSGGAIGWQKVTNLYAEYGWQAILLNGQGQLYVAGSTTITDGIGLIVGKFNTAGDSLWLRILPVPATVVLPDYDEPANQYLAIDPFGNIYVACEIGEIPARDIYLAKLGSGGDTLWTRRYDSPNGGDEELRGLAVDHSGNPVIAGSTSSAATNYDYLVVKYLANGTLSWEKRHDGGAGASDEGGGLALDTSGAVFITGYSTDGNSFPGVLTVKYSSGGDSLWADRYSGSYQYNYGNRILSDAVGDAYMIGSGYLGGDLDILMIHYNGTNGLRSDVLAVSGPASGGDGGTAIAADGNGDFYASGYAWYSEAHLADIAVVRFETMPSAVQEVGNDGHPMSPALSQNYPNPFNAGTEIRFDVPAFRHVTLVIYDVLGRVVRRLVDQDLTPGMKSVDWDAKDASGRPVASGLYLYRLSMGDFSESKTMVLLK